MLEGLNTLEYLTINNCSLTNLDNFPHLPKLIVLELSDNQYLLLYSDSKAKIWVNSATHQKPLSLRWTTTKSQKLATLSN